MKDYDRKRVMASLSVVPERANLLLRDMAVRGSEAHPTKVAFWEGGRYRTWADLVERAARLSGALHALGLRRGDACGIVSGERIEVYEHLLACMFAGITRVGVNRRYAPAEVTHVLSDSDCRVLLVDGRHRDGVEAEVEAFEATGGIAIGFGEGHAASFDLEELISQAEAFVSPIAESDDALLTYTSGTTGKPKGVVLSHRAVTEGVLGMVSTIGLAPDDILYVPVSHEWVACLMATMGFANGLTTAIPEGKFSEPAFLDSVARHSITATVVPPVILQRILDTYEADIDRYDLSSLRLINYGSSPATPALIRRTYEILGCRLNQTYGASEAAGGWLTGLQDSDHREGIEGRSELLSSAGRPSTRIELSIRDDFGKEVTVGETGEIWVNSLGIMTRYHKLPELTADTIRDGWLRTNDLGYRDQDGYLYLKDRRNFLIVTGGMNVFPAMVERIISDFPDVKETSVFGVPHADWGEAVVAAVIVEPGTTVDIDSLLYFARERLAGFEVPKFIDVVDNFPRGLTGKVLKHQLKAVYIEEPFRLPWNSPN